MTENISKNRIISVASALAAVMTLGSCQKDIDFKYHDIEPLQVIEGQLTQGGAEVRLTLTTPMDEPMDRTLLTDATVTVENLTDGSVQTLVPDETGVYRNATAGVAGHEYRLTVERDGLTFTAMSVMEEPTEITSLEFNWIKMPYDHVAVLQVRFRDATPASGDCYWVRIYRNGEAYSWAATTDNLADDGIVSQVFMTTRMDLDKEDDDTILRDGDEISASVCRVSRRFFDYLQAISSDSNGEMMFSGAPCLGYFLASPLATSSVIFRPDEIPYF